MNVYASVTKAVRTLKKCLDARGLRYPQKLPAPSHVLEVRVNMDADRARLRDWQGAGSACVVSAPRPSNWRP
jgi:hypothetical protein